MEVELIALLESYQVQKGDTVETFFILSEDGDLLLSEDGQFLILE